MSNNEEATKERWADVIVEFLRFEENGREKPLLLDGYRPHLRIVGSTECLGIEFLDGPEQPVEPGVKVGASVRFIYSPQVNYEGLVVGSEFEILEGPKVVGNGKVIRR